MKKQLSFSILLTILLSMTGMKAYAHDFAVVNADGKTIYYEISGSTTVSVCSGNPQYSGNIVIPASVTSGGTTYSVTSIGEFAFSYCSGLTSVTIPGSVESIGERAFMYCSDLTSITIPNSVTSIGKSAFTNCNCLTSVTIPNSVTTIGSNAFYGTGWYNNQSDGLLYLDNWLLGYKGNKPSGEHTITKGTKSIADQAFEGCESLTSVTILNGMTSIGESAFSGCSGLTSVTIPNSVTSIGVGAFSGCSSLTSPVYNATLFVYMPTTYSGSYNIPDGIEEICNYAFYFCEDLTSVTIPNSVTSIGESAFDSCIGLTSVTIGNNVTSIGYWAFCNCSGLTSVTIPNSVTSIRVGAFSGCSGLTSVTIPNSVTSIGEYVFSYCSGLTSVTIPNSVTSIGDYAFSGCSGLNSVFCFAQNPPTTSNDAFDSDYIRTIPLYVRPDCVETYGLVSPWSGFASINPYSDYRETIVMATSSGSPRTMKGYSSSLSLDFTNVPEVKAYIASGYTDDKKVILTRVNIVPANTGVVLITTSPSYAGESVEVPFTLSDVYYANLLQPAAAGETIQPTQTIGGVDYTNLMVGQDSQTGELGFISFASAVTLPSANCYLPVPTSFYGGAASARLAMVFVDGVTTDISDASHLNDKGQTMEQREQCELAQTLPSRDRGRRSQMINDKSGAVYDLQGRQVTPSKKGLYIRNGKKVFVK